MSGEKIAEFFGELDESLGLDALYDRGIPDPQAIHDKVAEVQSMVKIAEYDIPTDVWNAACDGGLLDVFDENVRHSLRQSPEVLAKYSGTPIEEHILSGLEGFGVIDRQ